MAVMETRTKLGSKEDMKKDSLDKQTLVDNQLLKDKIEDLKSDFNSLKKCVTCVICQDLLFEPYSLQCGHIFCYTCLLDWFQQKKTCPECRASIDRQPAPAYLVKDMVEVFVHRLELESPLDHGAELRKLQAEAKAAVERDKSSEGVGRKGGLFQGLFASKSPVKYGYRDDSDGMLRCPDCVWEVISGRCQNCGQRVRDRDADDDLWSDTDDDRDDDMNDDEDDEDSDASSSTDDSQVMDMDIDHFNFGRYVDEYDRRLGRANNPIPLDDDRASSARTNEGEEDEDNFDDDDSVREPVRRNIDGDNANDRQPRFAFRVEISDENAAATARRLMAEATRLHLAEERERERRRQRNDNRHVHDDDSDDPESEEEDEDDSLDGFIVNDEAPGHSDNHRRRGRSTSTVTTNTTVATTSSDISSSLPAGPVATNRRRRPVVLDEDDDEAEDQSSVSEASSRPANYYAGRSYTRQPGPIALFSDNDDDDDEEVDEEEDSLLGYTPLGHDTEDDGFEDMPGDSMLDSFSPISNTSAGRTANRGVTFAVREDSEGENGDGDANMIGGDGPSSPPQQQVTATVSAGSRRRRDSTPTTSSLSRRTRRSVAVASASEHTNTDTDDGDDDQPVTRRQRRIVGNGVGGSGRNHSGSHHASSNSHLRGNHQSSLTNNNNNRNSGQHRTRSTNNPFNRREIIPGISRMLRRHVQQRTENQFEHLARSSSSPARSVTPVPTNTLATGNMNNLSRTGVRGGVGSNTIDLSPSVAPLQQQQSTREASVGLPSGGGEAVSGERGSGGTTPVPISPSMGAGTRAASGSQYSSSSPFPSNTLSEIASLVSDPRSARADEAARLRASHPAVPVVTPPPPRTSVPRRDQTSSANITTGGNTVPTSPNNSTIPSSSPAPAAAPPQQHRPPQILHHHRDHNRAPTTLPPPGMLSPSARRLGHRGSRAGLRETGSRHNLRSSSSRNAIRSATPNPTSPTNNLISSPLNPTRTSSGDGSRTIVGTNLVDDPAGVTPRGPEVPRIPRYSREEIQELGAHMINRRLSELMQQQQANGEIREGRRAIARLTGTLTAARPVGWRTMSAPSASGTSENGNTSRATVGPASPTQRLRARGSRRDIGQVVATAATAGSSSISNAGGSSDGSNPFTAEVTDQQQQQQTSSPTTNSQPTTNSLFHHPFPQLLPRHTAPPTTTSTISLGPSPFPLTESPLGSPLSSPVRGNSLITGGSGASNSPYALSDSPTTSPYLHGRTNSGSAGGSGPGGVGTAQPTTPTTTGARRLGVGIGTGTGAGPMFIIQGGTDPGPADE